MTARPVIITQHDGRKRRMGTVRGDTLWMVRTEAKHLFRGQAASVQEAVRRGTAAWGMDLAACEALFDQEGVLFVEIETPVATYRARLQDVLSHTAAFTHAFGPYRPQTFLPLRYWTKTPRTTSSRRPADA